MNREMDELNQKIQELQAEVSQLRKNAGESKRRLSTLLENLPGMVYRCLNDEFWTMKFVSEGCLALTGHPPEHLIDNRRTAYAEMIHPDDRQAVWEKVQAGIDGHCRFNLIYRIGCADGAEKWVMETGQGVFSETGDLLAVEGFITDITEHRRSEEALRQSEQRYRQIVETCTDAILVRSGDWVVYANPAATRLFHANHAAELIGKRYLDLVHPEDRNESVERIRKGSEEKWTAPLREHRIVTLDGESVQVESTGVPIYHQGQTQLFGIFRDITERKKAGEALRQSEEKFRLAFHISPDAINLNRLSDGLYLDINEGFTNLTGFSRTETIGRTSLEIDIWADPADRKRLVELLQARGYVDNFESRFRRKNGQIGVGLMSARVIAMNQEHVILSITRDITDRKQTEEALRERDEIFNAFMEHSPVYVFFKDQDVRPIRLSRNFEQLLGRPIEEAIGKTMAELFPAELAEAMVADDLSVLNSGRPIKVVERFKDRTFETTKFPILQAEKPPMLAGFTIDITERDLAEQQREKLEARLRHAQKMEAIGSLAGGIAHDFNNILSVIFGYAELLQITGADFGGKAEVGQILAAAKRARDLVRQILAFSRQGEQQRVLMSLKPIIMETLEFLRASVPATIRIEQRLKPDLGTVMADPTQIQQVLLNLCANAVHAMEKNGGVLRIELDRIRISEKNEAPDPDTEPGDYLRITVSDTGQGIAPEQLPRIFEPYFTTKGPDKGTGLGLSVVHGIVKSHGGAIKVSSKTGQGTAFQVFLPRSDKAAWQGSRTEPELPTGSERILVVDDEIHLLETYRRMLEQLCYRVDTRTSPVEAVEALSSNPEKYDLVLTDMTMPQMNGYNLARRILEIRPDLPVILCTGFGDRMDEEKARASGIRAFLLKPVLFQDLAATLRKTLDQAGNSSNR